METVQKWECRREITADNGLDSVASRLGRDGWELVGFQPCSYSRVEYIMLFKRPIATESQQTLFTAENTYKLSTIEASSLGPIDAAKVRIKC